MVFLDDDEDLRATMSDLLRVIYHQECVCLGNHQELVAQADRVLACRVALLDVNLGPGQPSGLEAYSWLREHGFKGPIVFLTGHARSHPLVQKALALGDVQVLEKPIGLEDFDHLLDGNRAH